MKTIGFAGIGTMGLPMATRLLRSGITLRVWSRTPEKAQALTSEGAIICESFDELVSQCDVVILMLANYQAIEETIGSKLQGKLIVNMGTISPKDSLRLHKSVSSVGGRFVEAPVSGSRKPAEAGELICMLAGETEDVELLTPILSPMCKSQIACGKVPNALLMKLAVNTFLINSVTGLAESLNFAKEMNLDLAKFVSIINAGQMASDISRLKANKFLENDFSKQAGISDVLKNAELINDAAIEANIAVPLLQNSLHLYEKTKSKGFGEEDMIAVTKGFTADFNVHAWLKAWTGNNPEFLLSFYAPDAIYKDPSCPEGLSGEKLRTYFVKLLRKNPDWIWEAQEIITSTKKITLKWKATIPIDGNTISVEGLDLIETECGKIVRNEVYFDRSLYFS